MKLNYKELAYILDIKPIEALEKIIAVHCKTKGINVPRPQDKVKEYLYKGSPYPNDMDAGLLALHLNIPSLPDAVKDIQDNYLNRPATKKWILCDYPEKQIKSCADNDKPLRIAFPKALESLLPVQTADTIREEWKKRFPNARVV